MLHSSQKNAKGQETKHQHECRQRLTRVYQEQTGVIANSSCTSEVGGAIVGHEVLEGVRYHVEVKDRLEERAEGKGEVDVHHRNVTNDLDVVDQPPC